jgi:hypothetical protein
MSMTNFPLSLSRAASTIRIDCSTSGRAGIKAARFL